VEEEYPLVRANTDEGQRNDRLGAGIDERVRGRCGQVPEFVGVIPSAITI
jgi:hypothetical protein